MSNRPISVVELERRRLATAASLSQDLVAITTWGLKNMVEFNASKTQYFTLSNKRARKYFSPSNLLTLYKAQIRPSLEYCSHIWGAAAPTTLSILDAVQRRAIRLIGSKEEEKRTKYQELLGQLRRLWPDYAVSLLVMVIGSLGGMRNMLLSALRAIPVCRAAAHILAARMQKAVILGDISYLPRDAAITDIRQAEQRQQTNKQTDRHTMTRRHGFFKYAAEAEFLSKLHKDKPMHGIFYKHLEEHGLSQQLTFPFLRSSGLKSETEGFIMAC
nr:unnamed protein product [Callosobruchus chinensis]